MNFKIGFIVLLLACSSAFAFDLTESFSERSVLMQNLNGETNKINQEQKEQLKARKLAPTTKCLIEEIKKGNIENVELLLNAVDPNKNHMGDYPIYIASKYNKFEIVKLLRQKGAKLNKGFTSELYEAVKNKNSELAQYLIEEGARVDFRDSVTENTILYVALKNNMKDIAALLIEKGAKPDNQSVRYIHRHKLTDLIPSE